MPRTRLQRWTFLPGNRADSIIIWTIVGRYDWGRTEHCKRAGLGLPQPRPDVDVLTFYGDWLMSGAVCALMVDSRC